MSRYFRFFIIISFSFAALLEQAVADVRITTPAAPQENLAYCQDYFYDEWGTRLSMDGNDSGVLIDIPELQVKSLANFSYSNGALNFTTSDNASVATFLQYTVVGSIPIGTRYGEQKPINTAFYRILSMRLYSSKPTTGRILWFHAHDRYALTSFPIFEGWHTYQIDLATATIITSSGSNVGWQQGSAQGLQFLPSPEANVQMLIDWVMLTPETSACPTYTVNYSATAEGDENVFAIFADENTNYSDGVAEMLAYGPTAGAGSTSLSSGSLFPANYNFYSILSSDWASVVHQNPFDMSDAIDARSDLFTQLTNTSFSGGTLTATTTGTDPSLYLNIRNGETIDASLYSYFSIGITYDFPAPQNSGNLQVLFFDSTGTNLTGVVTRAVNEGYNLIQFQALPGDGWSGQIGGVRIDPDLSSGVTFSLDFVAIRSAGYVNSLSAPTSTAATGSVKINDFEFTMLQPDKAGGRDFGQTLMGNSWNMNAAGDVSPIFNVSQAYIYPNNTVQDPAGGLHTGDFFYAINAPNNGDAIYYSVLYNNEIDTSTFVNVCFRGWNSIEQVAPYTGYSSVARILWQDPREGESASSYKTGDDIVMARGANTYCVDMTREIELEPALPDGSPNPWTSIGEAGRRVNFFRVDMNENDEGAEAAYGSVLDYISLRTDHESNTQYAIAVEAPLSVNVELFANSARATSGGTPIGTLAAGRNSNVYKWDTTNVADGSYYIYGRVVSGGNTVLRLADGRVRVNHSLTQDTTAPILNCDRPSDNYLFDSQLELAGFALDGTRLATVEVFVDNVYFTSLRPSIFNLQARDTYAIYAESNTAGFQQLESGASIAYGPHTVKLVAVDTAGNETSCSVAVTRQVGASTTPIVYPEANGAPIQLDVDGVSGGDPLLNVFIDSNKNLGFAISGMSSCGTLSIDGAKKSNFEGALQLYSGAISGNVNLEAKDIPKFKGKKKKKGKREDGKLYFRANCGLNPSLSTTDTVNAKNIKNTQTASTEASLLKKIKSKIK